MLIETNEQSIIFVEYTKMRVSNEQMFSDWFFSL